MLRVLGRVGRIALRHSKKVFKRTSLFKSAPKTNKRLFYSSSVGLALVSTSGFFTSSGSSEKKEGEKIIAQAQSAINSRDWNKAIDRWNKLLALPNSDDLRSEFANFLMQTAEEMLVPSKDISEIRDKLQLASIIKLVMKDSKNDEESWQLLKSYFSMKLPALLEMLRINRKSHQNGKINQTGSSITLTNSILPKHVEDWKEVKTMAEEGLRHHIKSPEHRSGLMDLLQRDLLDGIHSIVEVKMFQDGLDAYKDGDWGSAILIWDNFLQSRRSYTKYVQKNILPILHAYLVHAWMAEQLEHFDDNVKSNIINYLLLVLY